MNRNKIILKCAAFLSACVLICESLSVHAQEELFVTEGQEYVMSETAGKEEELDGQKEQDSGETQEQSELTEEQMETVSDEMPESEKAEEGSESGEALEPGKAEEEATSGEAPEPGKAEEEATSGEAPEAGKAEEEATSGEAPEPGKAEEEATSGEAPESGKAEEEPTPEEMAELEKGQKESESEEMAEQEESQEQMVYASFESGSRQFVRRLYEILLEREADAAGIETHAALIDSGAGSASDIVSAMIDSSEFYDRNDSNHSFVGKLYMALMGRKAVESEITYWTDKMESGSSRRFVLAQFVRSDEFKNICREYGIAAGDIPLTENRDQNDKVTAYVFRCYKNILERTADAEGLNTWTGKLLSGGNGAEIVKDLVFSREFEEKRKSDGEFIDLMYRAMLGREADAGGKANWLDCLQKGVSYRYVINGFSGSEEFNRLCGEYGIVSGNVEITEARDQNIGVTGFVVRNYSVILGRTPDREGLNDWCGRINGRYQTAAQVSYGFVFSDECVNRGMNNADFVEMLYKACFGRNSDSEGKQYWINRLNTGTRREDIFWGFANSDEFNKMIAEFGIAGTVYNEIKLVSCEATACTDSALTVSVHAQRSDTMEKMSQFLYMVLLDSSGEHIVASEKISSRVENDWIMAADFASSDSFRAEAVGKYAVAVKFGEDYQVLSNLMYLSNPEIMAVTKKKYPGFYEGEIESKKGMQGVHPYATEELGIQASLLNVRLNELIKTSTNVAKYGDSCYVPYMYKGKTYYFHNMISYMNTVKALNGWSDEYGRVYRNVTLNLLLAWDDELQYLIHPAARSGGEIYYTLNMEEMDARETFEALFCYMAEKLGGSVLLPSEKSPYKYRIANWVLGNEVNACQAWNYSGNMSTQECADNYAEAFQILYQGVKRTDSEARIYISLDHDWNAGENGHGGREFLDEFASYMHASAPHMRWNVNYHPYSQPLTRNDFWNDYSNTTDDIGTRFISMRNLNVLTDYLGTLEHRYFPQSGAEYIRVILGEQGFTAASQNQEASQAAAIGYGFFIASMNTRVDAYIIRAYKDDPAEGAMKQGVMYRDETRKEAYDVYAALGTEDSIVCMNPYLHLVNENASSWLQILPGLNMNAVHH